MFKKFLYGTAALIATCAIAWALGPFSSYPVVGDTAGTTCLSFGNNAVCNQFRPAGPAVLTGNEIIPADTQLSSQNPVTVAIPTNLLGNGYGNTTIFSTTGTTAAVVVADGVSNFVYTGAGTATFTSFKLSANPINNQKACVINAGTGIITVSAVAASANSFGNTPTIVGVTPTSIPVAVASGAQATVTNAGTCWLYQAGASNNGIWYRVQ
jgi:hypothetical protein